MNEAANYLNDLTALARQTVSEGCVLLRNQHSTLPLKAGTRIAVFGTAQNHYYLSGLGSGGLVNTRGVTGFCEALEESGLCVLNQPVREAYLAWEKLHPFQTGDGWAGHPWTQEQMPLTSGLLADAASTSDAALVILGRTAGEDKDNADAPGSWLLTPDEETLLAQVARHFPRTIVLLNVGGIIDMSWVERIAPAAVMYIWQGGQEGTHGVVDVLFGRVSPSGRLPDTIAYRISDYPADGHFGDPQRNLYTEDIYVGYRYFETFAPDRVLYPFGAGLSYTTFGHKPGSVSLTGSTVTLTHTVHNTGSMPAKEVVQVYAQLPHAQLGKPTRTLCTFEKTALLQPGQQTDLTMTFDLRAIASYDDSGITGHRSCWLLERGDYRIYAGHDIQQAQLVGSFRLTDDLVLEQLAEACAPHTPFNRLCPACDGTPSEEPTPLATHPVNGLRSAFLPDEIPYTGDCDIRLADVYDGKAALQDFIAQLSDDDLCTIVRGEGMSSPRVTPGTAGAIGGVSDALVGFGIPAICCTDGPSGIRMDCGNIAFCLPSGTAMASTWNKELIRELYAREAFDMRKNHIDMLLGPGMNIHRHPLNGRNFEYFSEDPLLTGQMAAAQLQGLHRHGVTGVIKHFACNSQETMRRATEAVVSERALREIYLRGFEIAVHEGQARAIMTSYNPLNGVWAASNHDLLTVILRQQWGFNGVVMTDWWAQGSNDGLEENSTTFVASMIRAQNDLFMVMNNPASNSGQDDSAQSLAAGRITRAEYQRSAMSICRAILATPTLQRLMGRETDSDRQLASLRAEEGDVMLDVQWLSLDSTSLEVPGSRINMAPGQSTLFQVQLSQRGYYTIRFRYRVMETVTGVTQVSFAVSQDSRPLGVATHTGEDHNWHEATFTTGPIRRRLIFYLRIFTATGGIEIDRMQITGTEPLA